MGLLSLFRFELGQPCSVISLPACLHLPGCPGQPPELLPHHPRSWRLLHQRQPWSRCPPSCRRSCPRCRPPSPPCGSCSCSPPPPACCPRSASLCPPPAGCLPRSSQASCLSRPSRPCSCSFLWGVCRRLH